MEIRNEALPSAAPKTSPAKTPHSGTSHTSSKPAEPASPAAPKDEVVVSSPGGKPSHHAPASGSGSGEASKPASKPAAQAHSKPAAGSAPASEPKQAAKPASSPSEEMVKIRFLPQDDVVPDREIEVPKSEVGTHLNGPRFLMQEDPNAFEPPVADKNGNYIFKLDDPRLGATNAYMSASKALHVAEKYLGRTVDWGFERPTDKEHLWVHPHAGEGLNAFYNNQNGSINFLYDEDHHHATIDSSTSMEVVAHETGHAVLDGLRHNYLESLDASSSGFHEAFGDVLAMLTTLQEDDVIEAAYKETGGDLSQENPISRMGESMGKAMHGPDKEYVRTFLNDQKYKDAHFLPYMAYPEGPALEPHAYSQVWSGSMYDVLRLMVAEKMEDSKTTFVDAVKQTRDDIGRLAMRSIEFAPMGKISYKDAALATLKADAIDNHGANLKTLLGVFTMRNILTQDDAEKFVTDTAMIKMMRNAGKLNLPADFNPSPEARINGGSHYLKSHVKDLGLSKEEAANLSYVGCTTNQSGERILHFDEVKNITLSEPEWGAQYQGSSFAIHGGLVVAFDKDGKLETITRDAVTDDDVASSKHYLRKMIDFEKNPPIVIKRESEAATAQDHDLDYMMASLKNPIEVVNGTIKRSGIVY